MLPMLSLGISFCVVTPAIAIRLPFSAIHSLFTPRGLCFLCKPAHTL